MKDIQYTQHTMRKKWHTIIVQKVFLQLSWIFLTIVFFLAAKLHKASQIWRFCPAVRLCCQFHSTFHCLSVIWITKLQWLFEKLLDISARLCQWWFMQIQDSFIVSKIGNSCSSFFINVNNFSVAFCIEIASGKMKLSKEV